MEEEHLSVCEAHKERRLMKTLHDVLRDLIERGDVVRDIKLAPGVWHEVKFGVLVTAEDVIMVDDASVVAEDGDRELIPDSDSQFEARIFNAITRHPRIKFYLATRQKITSRAVELIWGLVETENLAIAERQRDHMREIE